MPRVPQTYGNHARFVPLYHYVASTIIVAAFIGSLVNLFGEGEGGLYDASLLVAMSLALALVFWFTRVFALRAQDRAIRAEENFRHWLLTGRPLDPRLNIRQVIGLRFASDEEFPALAERAAADGMSQDAIKRAVRSWRPDYDRA